MTTAGTAPSAPTGVTATAPPSNVIVYSGTFTTHISPPTKTLHLSSFRTPSSNIGCILLSGNARCDIRKRSWKPPPTPKSCPPIVNFGQGLELDATGPGRLVCAGDTAL